MALSTNISDAKRIIRSSMTLDKLKTALFVYVLVKYFLKAERHLFARGITQSVREIVQWVTQRVIMLALQLPSAREKVAVEMGKAKVDIEAKLIPTGAGVSRHLVLSRQGQTPDWIAESMDKMDTELEHRADYKDGKLSGAVYHGGEDIEKVVVAAFQRYCVSNPLHPDVFPAIRKMDAEVVSMVLNMYSNPNGAGTTTSGGTESILLAVKTHRDWARATKGITEPELVVSASAHAAFFKAAQYFKIKLHVIPVDFATRQVPIKRMARAINPNTIMIVGSAINFPDGCQDDIVALGKLAKKNKIGLHVDCCLGSFIMPFLKEAGFPTQPFDFSVEGVTSISCDTHKYGFAPKGSSVIMYRSTELRRYQYYVQPDWAGGVYASPTFAGSRPGAILAGAWAAMQYMGHDGYLQSCRDIVGCAKKIEKAIREEIKELYVLGKPTGPVVAFASQHPAVNVLSVGDAMSKRGWHLNGLSQPAAVHIACTRLTVPIVDTFITDLKDSVAEAKANPSSSGSMVSVYGLGNSSAVGHTMVGELACTFIDTLYKA